MLTNFLLTSNRIIVSLSDPPPPLPEGTRTRNIHLCPLPGPFCYASLESRICCCYPQRIPLKVHLLKVPTQRQYRLCSFPLAPSPAHTPSCVFFFFVFFVLFAFELFSHLHASLFFLLLFGYAFLARFCLACLLLLPGPTFFFSYASASFFFFFLPPHVIHRKGISGKFLF